MPFPVEAPTLVVVEIDCPAAWAIGGDAVVATSAAPATSSPAEPRRVRTRGERRRER
ncbi:hypothetical protein G5V59_12545 [Nocardioides sp. W3-2-3]|uniref:hypothetical protein n=1 Tax=Nocardioides convexus TaxID=2712224 RepID=UPI00241816A2|nr:hypothetical protein [Nocardioides convexus]NHA00572.1 hypothetical protein [Nocardioides convexus]